MRATPSQRCRRGSKTDANDALGLAQMMRVGWYREVMAKGLDCQAVNALLVAGRDRVANQDAEE
jgi:hypothetical protein